MKTCFIAIAGKPNVGKSTLLNTILGEKVAIVTSKPQTTRTRITGVYTRGEDQFVFLDTPGIHKPKDKLGELMVTTATNTIGEVDAVYLVVEPDGKVGSVEKNILEKLKTAGTPTILVINKTDDANAVQIGSTIQAYADIFDFDAVVPLSALKNRGIDILINESERYLEESNWYFDADALTDQPERQLAAEIIREKLLRLYDDEIPHGIAVVIEEFKEEGKLLSIRAEIFCEKDTHKAIIIGKKGAALKQIGTYAREDLEKMFGIKVYLNLWVKVKEKWRDSTSTLANFGFRKD